MAEAKQLDVDRAALRAALSIPNIRANSEWCVACGASATDAPELPDFVGRQIEQGDSPVRELINPEYVGKLAAAFSRAEESADWCVACGAQKSVDPAALVSNPVALSDAEIDAIATKFLGGSK